jgi:uncharacterized protein involved in exopolysaccharide biosynthesis
MMAEIRFYVMMLLRRLPLIIAVGGTLSAVAVAYALTRPAIYSAEALLLVEAPQIPGNLAATTVSNNAPEQLEIIEQRILSRSNLLDIADSLNVFPDRSGMVPDDIVDSMRRSTSFRRAFGRDRATTLRIRFTSPIPEVTAAVANEYVTRVLVANSELRTGIAEETMEFFEQEVQRLGEEMDLQSARILEFQNSNIDALPGSMDYRLNRQSQLSERRAQLEREATGLRDQRARVVELFESTGRLGNVERSPKEQQLERLQDELSRVRVVFSDQNPQVRILIAQIDRLEAEIVDERGLDSGDTAQTPQQVLFEAQLAEIDARQSFIGDQMTQIDAELQDLQASIARTPENSITLAALERDYQNLRGQYDSAIARLATAATGERIELTAKGQRISVLRQAVVPREPDSPNRRRLMLMGVVAAFGIAGALALGLDLINRAIRRPADLVRSLEITPLGTVPYIPTRTEVLVRRGLLVGTIVIFAIAIPAGLYLVHMQFMPLDLLAARAIERIGL